VNNYLGQLVVLRTLWNLQSHRIGVIVEKIDDESDKFLVMWTIPKGIELKIHVKDALMPITNYTSKKIEERACVFK